MKSFDKTWDVIHSQKKWGNYPCEDVIRFMARNYYNVEDRSKIKVLDFGCGAGSNTWYLAREGFSVTALDGAATAIANTCETLKSFGENAELICADGLANTFKAESFDCIIDNRTIFSTNYQNVIRLYKETYRLLKRGGRLFSACFSSRTTGAKEATLVDRHTYTRFRGGIFSSERTVCLWDRPEEMEDVLGQIGYRDIVIELHSETQRNMTIYNELYIVSALKGANEK